MITTIWIFSVFLGWFFIGCCVLAAVDDEHQSLFKWAKEAPIPGLYELTVMAWPYVAWKYRWSKAA